MQTKRTKPPLTEEALRQQTAAILMRQPLSRGLLLEKLRKKGAGDRMSEQAADWAESIGLLNDRDYAERVVQHYKSRGYGIYKIREELYRRRVPRDLWEEVLEESEDSEEVISRFLAAKSPDPYDPAALKKVSDALVRRGFRWSEIAAGIEHWKTEWMQRGESQ